MVAHGRVCRDPRALAVLGRQPGLGRAPGRQLLLLCLGFSSLSHTRGSVLSQAQHWGLHRSQLSQRVQGTTVWGGEEQIFKVSSETSPWQKGGGKSPGAPCLPLGRRDGGPADVSFIASSFHVPGKANPPQIFISPLLQHRPWADGPALGWPCRVNPPCPPALGTCTTREKHEQHLC